jgi:hypothetical protein
MKKYPCWCCYGEGEIPSDAYMRWHIGKDFKRGDYSKIKDACPYCSGSKKLEYDSLSDYISDLLLKYNRDTQFLSFTDLEHPSIVTILSKKTYKRAAVHVLFKGIKDKRVFLISPITLLLLPYFMPTKEVPTIPEEIRGRIIKMLQFWKRWGIENGYIANM